MASMTENENDRTVQNGEREGEKVTNIHGESLTSRLEKYKVDNDAPSHRDSSPSSSKNSSSTNLSEAGKFLPTNTRSKASPTNSAAARAHKKTRSYEVLQTTNGRQQTTYEQLRINGQVNGSPAQNGLHNAPAITVTPAAEGVPITIPSNGNLQNFTVDELATFFRYMRIDERIVQRLKTKGLDGKRFGKLKDKTFEDLGVKNPIIMYFRDRSGTKEKINFML